MHLAKGLEFKAVAVIACDEDQLPLRSRVAVVAEEIELDDVYATERHLFYVACTRARDRLLVTEAGFRVPRRSQSAMSVDYAPTLKLCAYRDGARGHCPAIAR
jgi:superfamily I DNA/RNA helicase